MLFAVVSVKRGQKERAEIVIERLNLAGKFNGEENKLMA